MPPNDADEPLLQPETGRSRFVLHPVRHHDVYEMAETAEEALWTTGEVDLSRDLADLDKLTPEQRHYLETVLAFFAASDGIVIENLGLRFLTEVQMPEARYFYGIQLGIETIHSKMYSLLIDAYVTDAVRRAELFDALETMPCIQAKAQWALEYVASDTASFATRVLAFAIVEGVFFSSSFAAIFYFNTLGLMPGLSMSNRLISLDEGKHTEFAVLLYTKYVKNRLPAEAVNAMFREAVAVERAFVDDSLPDNLLGMNQTLMRQYVEYVADRLLLSLGYKKIFLSANPFDFIDNLSCEAKTNFFEARVAEYKRSNVGATVEEQAFNRSVDF